MNGVLENNKAEGIIGVCDANTETILKSLEFEYIFDDVKKEMPEICSANIKDAETYIIGYQVRKLVRILNNAGVVPAKIVKTNTGDNQHYVGEKCVLIVINRKNASGIAPGTYATIIDRSFYDEFFNDLDDGEKLTVCISKRHAGDYKIMVNGRRHGKIYADASLHQLVCKHEDGKQIDHISCSTLVNMAEYLRSVTGKENMANRKYYSRIDLENLSFISINKVNDMNERIELINQDYKFLIKMGREYIRSRRFSTKVDLYNALNMYENKYLKQFRYNPLVDFSETWYALVVDDFLGEVNLHEYNRNYAIRTEYEKVEYYQLQA